MTNFSFLLSAVNSLFMLVWRRLIYMNHRVFYRLPPCQIFLQIINDMGAIHFVSDREHRVMILCGGLLELSLRSMSCSKDKLFSLWISNKILMRVLSGIMFKIGAPGIESCMRVIAKYSLDLPSVKILVSTSVLNSCRLSSQFGLNWLFLLSQLPDPRALQHLKYARGSALELAIICREFRRLFMTENIMLLRLLWRDSSYQRRKNFFRFPRKISNEFNSSFRILKRIFRKQLRPGMSHYDICERIICIFLKMMSRTNQRTWSFLCKAFTEESFENLQVLSCDDDDHDDDDHDDDDGLFSFEFKYPNFMHSICVQSSEILKRFRRMHFFVLSPSMMNYFRRMSDKYYLEDWQSIIASGLYWILKMIEHVQAGRPEWNFALHSVVHEQNHWLYQIILDLFLNGAIEVNGCRPELCKFWNQFSNMRGKYADTRTVPFSEMLSAFFRILEDPQFFERLQLFCKNDFDGLSFGCQIPFSVFCQSIRATEIEAIFRDFFYPRVYVLCKFCRAQILYLESLKRMRVCGQCCEERGLLIVGS
jgi:hypothetical protein